MDPAPDDNDNWKYSTPPEMRLFELKEHQCRRDSWTTLYNSGSDLKSTVEVTLKDGNWSVFDDPDYFRMFQVRRFFGTIQGFLKRLDELKPLWSAYFEDFLALKSSASASFRNIDDIDLTPNHRRKEIFHTVDKTAWKDFRVRWKIPRACKFNDLVSEADIVSKCFFLSNFEPKIQSLCLTDLPSEMLDHIISFTSLEQARLLSATCRQLRQIGLPYLFETRDLSIRLPDPSVILESKQEDMDRVQKEVALGARGKFLGDVEFFLSRPDIAQQTRRMWFKNDFRTYKIELDGDLASFYEPINNAVCSTLRAAVNLHALTIYTYDLEPDLLIALSQLRYLRELSLIGCRRSDILMTSIGILPKCNQVRLLKYADHSNDFDQGELSWFMLFLFPGLQVLNLLSPDGELSYIPPPPVIIRQTNIFQKIRYLSLYHFYDLPALSDWIRRSHSQRPLELTHLKLMHEWGLSDEDVMELLDVLRLHAAPLRVLALDGLRDANLALFEHIVDCFPDLLGLSLIRRENYRQYNSEPCSWPRASWEYAPIFSRFTRLEYFSWNFRLLDDHTSYPAVMLAFEEQAEFERREEQARMTEINWDLWELLLVSDEFDCVDAARLFAAYCPSLKTLSSFRGSSCSIERSERGSSVITSSVSFRDAMTMWGPVYLQGWQVDAGKLEEKNSSTNGSEGDGDHL
ncbi:hypothetical protein GYMLUDRAFT_55703 [Collybiopsis luxurians FD-317 M1]|nr:hypothetical protein GYMLUDRAFT_55703 [Collybiopsis luxurians FD-317 M1]